MKILEKHFDGLLYLANWGSRHLHFRLPRQLVDRRRLANFCIENAIALVERGDSVILSFTIEQEEISWIEDEGDLGAIMPLRQQILDSDLRAVYLVWLKACAGLHDQDLDDTEPKLPVPPGLGDLDEALNNLATFFDINPDLIEAAAAFSPAMCKGPDLFPWLEAMNEAEKLHFLAEILAGKANVQKALSQRLLELQREAFRADESPAEAPEIPFRSIMESAQNIKKAREEKADQAREKMRLQGLNDLAARAPAVWLEVESKVKLKNSGAYRTATDLLKQLEQLANHQGDRSGFFQQIRALRVTYAKFPGFLRRLDEAGLH